MKTISFLVQQSKTIIKLYGIAKQNNMLVLLKGTGTQDLIWLKVVSLDRSWLVGLTDDL